jgi:hypothetical protein
MFMVEKSRPAAKAGLVLFYVVALIPGLLLIGIGFSGRWQVAPLLPNGPTLSPTSEEGRQLWASRLEPAPAVVSPAAPVKPKLARSELDCTDLRALFGLGEPLTDRQRRYLQEHC